MGSNKTNTKHTSLWTSTKESVKRYLLGTCLRKHIGYCYSYNSNWATLFGFLRLIYENSFKELLMKIAKQLI